MTSKPRSDETMWKRAFQYVKKCYGVYRVDENTLFKIRVFYEEHKQTLDDMQIPTLDFMSGKETDLIYPKVKLVDMYGFIKGQR